MRKTLIILGVIVIGLFFLLRKCGGDDESRENPKGSYKVCDSIYAERFDVFNQGAFGGGRFSEWLTDSANFRILLGSYDEIEGGFSYKCKGDTIYVTQRPDGIAGNPKDKPVTSIYKISDLRKKQNLNNY